MPDRPLDVVILAAGRASRMGSDKMMMDVEGEPMIRRVVRSVQGYGPILVVTGANADALRATLGPDVRFVPNPRPDEGLGSSIAVGVAACRQEAATLLVLGDMPWMNRATLDAIVRTYRGSEGTPIVVPVCEDRSGNPVLFDPAHRPALLRLSGDEGGRRVWVAASGHARFVPVADPRELDDVDVPTDL